MVNVFDISNSDLVYKTKKENYMKKLIITAITLASLSGFAESDLNLNGEERWEAKFTGYKCGAYGENITGPTTHQYLNVKFEYLRSDYTLDNALIKGTFMANGQTCSYSAILFADNGASTIKLVDSKAFSQDGFEACAEGKKTLDSHLEENDYLYWGHPHHATVMMPVDSASQFCGEGATHIGLDFTVSKFLGQR